MHDEESCLMQFKQALSLCPLPLILCLSKLHHESDGEAVMLTRHVIGLDLSSSFLYGSIDSNALSCQSEADLARSTLKSF
uniref:Uncharacterized protein n=1 Tax=Salix viminalis TaxID=40686 RepID=A0A6N2MKP6_SALVM